MWKLLRPDALDVLDDERARKSLNRYFSMVRDNKPAKFKIAKKLSTDFTRSDSTETLWKKHACMTENFEKTERAIDNNKIRFQNLPAVDRSYLDLKVELAQRMLAACHLCARNCGVNRLSGNLGYCRCDTRMSVSSIFAHTGEEPELVPSGTVFTMGCTMQCKHCQNWTISQWMEKGTQYEADGLAREVTELKSNGCRNINLVGGEPTPWLLQWLQVFEHVDVNVPIVWNSNTYYSQDTACLLAGFADVYLLDFKYGPGECAERISATPFYWGTCTRNHLKAKKHGELIIRVLVLPNHLECCTEPIVNWIAGELGVETRVNIMFQYRPEWRANEIPELRRRLTREEMKKAVRIAKDAGLANFIT